MTNLIRIFKFLVVAMAMTRVVCKQSITMKTLILSTSNLDNNCITLHLKSYGIPYDIINFSHENILNGNLTLYNENNEPKYNLVVINGGGLLYELNNLWVSALSRVQWAYLEEYEAKNSVRRIVISEDVSSNPEVQLADPNNWGETLSNQPLYVENTEEINGIFKDTRVKITVPLNVNDIYHTKVKIINEATTKPFLYYDKDDKEGNVAAIFTKYEDGREKMSFFFGLGSWSQTSNIINHLWLTWGTRSLFNGFRRVYFTAHIDDVFLDTVLVDPKNNEIYGSQSFRTTPFDFKKIAQFQKDIIDIMPEGSFYRVELAFNGNGILNSGNYNESLKVDGNRYVDIEFVKEPGTGDKRWPMENYQFSPSQIETLEKDEVFNYFNHNETNQKEFFWSSHTFTHENLDNVSRSDVDNEIRLNIEIAERLGLTEKEYWSGGSIITPQISGLHNKDALEIFMKYGINSATGDLSRPAISNIENPYLPFYTTLESSNLEGFPIIPRTPTEIYYHCSTREEDTWVYNQIYHDYFGVDSTFDEILKRESERTTLLMTKLRHEAHQFHQANIRYYPKEGKYGESFLEDWTRISLSINQQAETFLERAKLEACGHKTQFIIENNKVVGISVSASKDECTVPVTIPTGVKKSSLPDDARLEQLGNDPLTVVGISVSASKDECTVPVTIPTGVKKSSLPDDARLEQLGNDPLTVWIPLKKGETKTFELEPGFEWNINESIEPISTTTIVESTIVDEPTTTIVESSTVVEPTTVVESSTDVESTTTIIESSTVVEPTTTIIESFTVVEPTTTVVKSTTVIESNTTKTEISTTIMIKPTELDSCENDYFARCGGIGFTGSTCCKKGLYCKVQNPYYYQCVSLDDEVVQNPDPTTTKKSNSTIKQTSTTSDIKPTGKTCENGPFDRCGGIGFEGTSCCGEGYVCFPHNDYYYQCISIDSVDQFLIN
ncbi:carbohydrate-binding module family 1 protein [Piromyces sp. E2]|nr:carbohydrate-binding module family 1 protein [Piromyces sp. E2]|eukprot:OUM66708.1 carbohydrate-binding module family 1 protein [Piromyces sp. E2]